MAKPETLRGLVARHLAPVLDALRADGPLASLCLALVVAGVTLRVQQLGFPSGLTFDEHHFVDNARKYLLRQPDLNDHPPLGKLLIALGMLALRDNSTGWRIVPVAFGVGSIIVARCLAMAAFRDRRAGWLAAAFVAADGFLITYSRTALLDGILTTLVLLAAWLVLSARSPLRAALAAAVIGCAASIKLSGFALGFAVLGLYLVRRRPLSWIASLGLAPIVFGLWFSIGLWLSHKPFGPRNVLRATTTIIRHHAGLTDFSNALASHWYTWFLPVRPIVLSYDRVGLDLIRARSSLGNLVLWWSTTAVFWASALFAVGSIILALRARIPLRSLDRYTRATVALFGLALVMLLPWMIARRDSYIYHYLPSYAFLLVLLAGWIARRYQQHRSSTLIFLGAVALVFAFYAPVWGQLPLTDASYRHRLFAPGWR